jgi:hypothetical protein
MAISVCNSSEGPYCSRTRMLMAWSSMCLALEMRQVQAEKKKEVLKKADLRLIADAGERSALEDMQAVNPEGVLAIVNWLDTSIQNSHQIHKGWCPVKEIKLLYKIALGLRHKDTQTPLQQAFSSEQGAQEQGSIKNKLGLTASLVEEIVIHDHRTPALRGNIVHANIWRLARVITQVTTNQPNRHAGR